MAGVALVLFAVVCGEFLAPPLQAMAKQQKLLAKFSTITFAGRGGPWVRDGDKLINVSQQSAGGEFGGMRIFELTPDHELRSMATASTATVQPDGGWLLSHYASTTFGGERIESELEDSRMFQSTVGGDFLALTVLARASSRRACCGISSASAAERSRCDGAGCSRSGRASRARRPSCSPRCSPCPSSSAACARPVPARARCSAC
jgi:hypothetical protein